MPAANGMNLDLLRHNLRESWRHFLFAGWLTSGRRDAVQCSAARYNAKRCELARKAVARSHALRAVMAGASVSPVVFAIMQGRRNDPHAMECPFCHAATGTLDHVVWRCRSLPDVNERPRVPRDALQHAWDGL